MKIQTTFYYLSTGDNFCSVTQSVAEAEKQTWLCGGCNFPRPDSKQINVLIQTKSELVPGSLASTGVSCVCLAPIALVRTLNIFDQVSLGTVTTEDDGLLDDWVTVRTAGPVQIMRGNSNVSYRLCEICGRNVYYAGGPTYLFPSPPSNFAIFNTDTGGLLITEELFDRIPATDIRTLRWRKVVVALSPRDGLGELPAYVNQKSA